MEKRSIDDRWQGFQGGRNVRSVRNVRIMSQIVRIFRIFGPESIIFFSILTLKLILAWKLFMKFSKKKVSSMWSSASFIFSRICFRSIHSRTFPRNTWCPTKKLCSRGTWYWRNNFRIIFTIKVLLNDWNAKRCTFFLSMSHSFLLQS